MTRAPWATAAICAVALTRCAALRAQAAAPIQTQPAGPIAIVPIDNKSGASVTGALEVAGGKAILVATGSVTSGAEPTDVMLPHRGMLRVCASTTVKLAADASAPSGDAPGLMMAMDHGAVEASFLAGRNADVLLTPDFRILIGGPGAVELKVRLGEHGDTCIDNPGANAPYVLATSVFDASVYRVQPGQHVMLEHGSAQTVVDNEKEPCGCPPASRPGSNDFPMTQSAGLGAAPAIVQAPAPHTGAAEAGPLVYNSTPPAQDARPTSPEPAAPAPSAAPAASPKTTSHEKKTGFLSRVGRFFRELFGAE